jgi:hypothetical protein
MKPTEIAVMPLIASCTGSNSISEVPSPSWL